LLVLAPPNAAVSDLVRFVKANSSRWIRGKFDRAFGWQAGYGAFSVSRSRFGEVRAYVEGQMEHHKRVSFESEFVSLLKRNEIEFENERLWG
jgi:REP element-mobilizing transposase RayT